VNREWITAASWLKWLAITVACAAPLHNAVNQEAKPSEFAGEALALATWATGMAFLETIVARRNPTTRGRSLTIGFAAWAVVQCVLAVCAFRGIVDSWMALHVLSTMPGMLLLFVFDGSDVWLGRASGFDTYVLTVSCGLFDFTAGLLATAAVASFTRPRRSPPPDTAPSPAPPP